jgi:DNA-binding MarR family transcriptional regulator
MRQWRHERPDLDPTPVGVFGRVFRLCAYFSRSANVWLGQLGLTWEAFSLIVTLRRSGKPYALRPTDLLHESLLSSGAITNRIDRVEQLGFVRRVSDPNDRRGVAVQLTPRGRALADRAIERHFAELTDLLSELTAEEIRDTAALMSRLLLSLEGPQPDKHNRQPISRNLRQPARQGRGQRRAAAKGRALNRVHDIDKPSGR